MELGSFVVHRLARILTLLLALSLEARAQELEACADCHESIVASWANTGMARALGPVRAGEFEGLAQVVEPGTGLAYALEVSSGRARIFESLEISGREPHRTSAPLAFAIGAGVKDRSYAALRHGRLWFAPLEVVSALDNGAERSSASHAIPRHAALSPPHMMQSGLRFDAPITPECLACHTDSLPPRDFPLNLMPEEGGENGWIPRGISCGACHARAGEHAAWRAATLAGEERSDADPISDFEALARHRRVSVCAACHLQGDVRIELGAIGLPPAGDELLDHRAIFVARQPTNEIGFVSQVERMVLSRCYLESSGFSGGGLACESCHDPHRSLEDARERARVRAACLECHAQSHAAPALAPACSLAESAKPAGSDCVACHMRETGVFDVAGVAIRDHWIRKDPGGPSPRVPLRFPESPDGDWRRFLWPDVPPPSHADDPGLWMMAFYQGGLFPRATPLLERRASSAVERLPMFHHVRGALLERAGRNLQARAAYERALELDPELGEAATNLGLVLGRIGDAQQGIGVLTELLERHPRTDGALRNRALLARSLGDEEAFIRDLERALELKPDAAVARALAQAYEARGDAARAAHWNEEARRLDPLATKR